MSPLLVQHAAAAAATYAIRCRSGFVLGGWHAHKYRSMITPLDASLLPLPALNPHATQTHTHSTHTHNTKHTDNGGKPLNITSELIYLPSVSRTLRDTQGRAWPGNAAEEEGMIETRCWCVSLLTRVHVCATYTPAHGVPCSRSTSHAMQPSAHTFDLPNTQPTSSTGTANNTRHRNNDSSCEVVVRVIDTCPCKQVLPDGAHLPSAWLSNTAAVTASWHFATRA